MNFFFHSIPDDDSGEKSVSVLLSGEESELVFIDHSSADMSVSIEYEYRRKLPKVREVISLLVVSVKQKYVPTNDVKIFESSFRKYFNK